MTVLAKKYNKTYANLLFLNSSISLWKSSSNSRILSISFWIWSLTSRFFWLLTVNSFSSLWSNLSLKKKSFYKNFGQLIQQETVKLPEKSKSLSFKSSKDLSVSLYADPLSISTVGIHWMSATNKFFGRVSTAWLVTVCK